MSTTGRVTSRGILVREELMLCTSPAFNRLLLTVDSRVPGHEVFRTILLKLTWVVEALRRFQIEIVLLVGLFSLLNLTEDRPISTRDVLLVATVLGFLALNLFVYGILVLEELLGVRMLGRLVDLLIQGFFLHQEMLGLFPLVLLRYFVEDSWLFGEIALLRDILGLPHRVHLHGCVSSIFEQLAVNGA
jgi:hypothetical protein